jgi:hypothetical protein
VVAIGKEKRLRFQFHLITAVAMMVVAGAFVGLNVFSHEGQGLHRWSDRETIIQRSREIHWHLGYPVAFYYSSPDRCYIDYTKLMLDVVALLFWMLITYIVFEAFANRRTANHRPAPPSSSKDSPPPTPNDP